MKLGSLCSGAGGLDLAVEAVLGAETVWHCELEKLPGKDGGHRRNAAVDVLATHWPDVPNHGDLTTVDWSQVEPVDILTGGYPCQPFSHAGKRKGTDDERHIWPGIREAIRRLRPRITFLENVSGHRSLGFDRVLGDLAEDGLHARWVSLRAADVGACHGRERLWIVVTDPARDRWDQGRPESARLVGRPDVAVSGDRPVTALLPTPQASDGNGGKMRSQEVIDAKSRQIQLTDIARLLSAPSATDTGGDLLPTPCARDFKDATASPGAVARNTPSLGAIEFYLPTPAAADAERGPDFARAGRDGSGGDDLVTICARATREICSRWGKYQATIERWETLTRPAPSPTEPNTKGNPRLNPAFPEWMMGWPAGWVTDVPGISRNDQLRIIGNGVVPQCAAAALTWLLNTEVRDA